MRLPRPFFLPIMLVVAACGAELVEVDPDPTSDPIWYATCGDPACGGYAGPVDGVPACADEVEGAACAAPGAACDLQDDCNTQLVCASEDPKGESGGACPVSRAKAKVDVHYLSSTELAAVRDATLGIPLATWRYVGADPASRARLGFILDDRPSLPAAALDGEHVDVYGLAAMAVATVQTQAAEFSALRAQQAALEARLAALEGRSPR
jgi:hypothetical protein